MLLVGKLALESFRVAGDTLFPIVAHESDDMGVKLIGHLRFLLCLVVASSYKRRAIPQHLFVQDY
jgi:hypothetical protein